MKTSPHRWYRTPRIVLEMDAACAAWLDERCPLPNSDDYEVAWTHARNTKLPTAEPWEAFALDMAEHGYSIDASAWAAAYERVGRAWAARYAGKAKCPPPP